MAAQRIPNDAGKADEFWNFIMSRVVKTSWIGTKKMAANSRTI
jgi:hypothetical protein